MVFLLSNLKAVDTRWKGLTGSLLTIGLLFIVIFTSSVNAQPSRSSVNDHGVPPLLDKLRDPIVSDGYVLHFVQLDDLGFLRDSDKKTAQSHQLSETLHDIRDAGLGNSITVVFVHGWNHNAEQCDDNVLCFESCYPSSLVARKRP